MSSNAGVFYVFKGGAAARYAEMVAGDLAAAGHQVHLVDLTKNRKPDLTGYQLVVLATGVRTGMVYREAEQFLRHSHFSKNCLALALATGTAETDPEMAKKKFLMPLVHQYHLEPVMWDSLPGNVPGSNGGMVDETDLDAAHHWTMNLCLKLSTTKAG